MLGIAGSGALARAILPSVPDPTASPLPTGGVPIAGMPALVGLELRAGPAGGVVRISSVSATDAGVASNVRTLSEVSLPDVVSDRGVTLRPHPMAAGGAVIEVDTGGRLRVIVVTPGGQATVLDPPAAWPASTDGRALSPDGGSLATAGPDPAGGGKARVFVWTLRTGELRSIPMPDAYAFVASWPRPDRIQVAYQVCTEGCEGRYPFVVNLDARTGRVQAVLPDGTSEGQPLHFAYQTEHGIRLEAINDEKRDDLSIALPAALAGAEPRDWFGTSLLAIVPAPDGAIVYELRDAYRHAIADQAADARRLGTLPFGVGFASVSPDGSWIVDLATGRSYAVPASLQLEWAPPR
jgi:hypothetical protein